LSGESGAAYNLGTGAAVSIRTLLEAFVQRSPVNVTVEVDAERLRVADAPCLVSDTTRFRERTGWEPVIPLDQTVDDILSFWRAHLAA